MFKAIASMQAKQLGTGLHVHLGTLASKPQQRSCARSKVRDHRKPKQTNCSQIFTTWPFREPPCLSQIREVSGGNVHGANLLSRKRYSVFPNRVSKSGTLKGFMLHKIATCSPAATCFNTWPDSWMLGAPSSRGGRHSIIFSNSSNGKGPTMF